MYSVFNVNIDTHDHRQEQQDDAGLLHVRYPHGARKMAAIRKPKRIKTASKKSVHYEWQFRRLKSSVKLY